MGELKNKFTSDEEFTIDETHVAKGNTKQLRVKAMSEYQDAINGIFDDWKGEPVMIVRVKEDSKGQPIGKQAVVVGVGGVNSLVSLVEAGAEVMTDIMESVDKALKEK